ncbi:hypothetical protein PG984_003958 [Apiospora sp. TS-2023a]
MSFTVAVRPGPARLATKLPQLTKTALRTNAPIRSFHRASSKPSHTFFTPRTLTAASVLRTTSRNAFSQSLRLRPTPGSLMRRLLTGGAIFGGTLIAINTVFNRETRFVYRIMVTNPWAVAIGGLALSFGTMIGTRMTDPDNYVPKYALWTAFNATQAAFVAPLLVMAPPALIARAGLYTMAMMGSISFVGATAKQEKYMYIGGPLLAGAGIVMVSGLAPLVLPVTAARTLAFTQNIWLYGGLAVFGGFTLYDVQKVLHHARMAERGIMKKDPVNESISLELDFLNIFIRMVQILMMQQNRRK